MHYTQFEKSAKQLSLNMIIIAIVLNILRRNEFLGKITEFKSAFLLSNKRNSHIHSISRQVPVKHFEFRLRD